MFGIKKKIKFYVFCRWLKCDFIFYKGCED